MLNSRVAIMWVGVYLFLILATITSAMEQSPRLEKSPDTHQIEHGRYLVKIAGCNDCHTPGYIQKTGNVPEEEWLTGNRLGWRGPWGTTYPSNLRTYMNRVSESQWVKVAHTAQFRPPMPWFALHEMTEEDLRAIYSFVWYLGPSGNPAPSYVPPDQEPTGPYVLFPMPPTP
jgi:mono/diheme cytochrome c family protein